MCCDRRAVRVDFGVNIVNDVSEEVVSFDVVPAFTHDDHHLIPDDVTGEWIHTNPKIHAEQATAANKAFAEQWKPLVKMIKKWNEVAGHPVEPSFLIEVMALTLITGPWTGNHPRELRQFFASAADRIADCWPDPAGVGPDISDALDSDNAKMANARKSGWTSTPRDGVCGGFVGPAAVQEAKDLGLGEMSAYATSVQVEDVLPGRAPGSSRRIPVH